MKAALINGYGGPAVMSTEDGVPKPKIKPNQVLIAVHAAGVNPFDWKVREGLVRSMGELHFPAILGGDLAGVVEEVGEDVIGFAPGDEVYGLAGARSGQGSFAEYAPVSGGQISAKPKGLSFTDAAALPLAGVSALQAIVETIDLQPGQKILIHGGSGGIGSVAIQIAAHLGAHVAVTASGGHTAYLKALGADEVIDYKSDKFTDHIQNYDAVFDTAGGNTYADSFGVLRPGGVIVTVAGQADPQRDAQYDVTSHGQYTQVTGERLAKLTQLVQSGAVSVRVAKIFPLGQAADALAYLQNGHPKGKVVIVVAE